MEEETGLPVPSGPTEVTSLAKSFNALLTQLHARQEQQKTFVMNAAHELRTPIAAIKSHAQLMERRAVQHPEIVPKSVAYITEESRQMQQLIDELMELSRADQFKFESKFFDLSQLLNEVLCKLRPNFSQNIEAFITPHVQFKGNSLAIERIVENLLTNAAKYSLAGSSIQVILAVNKGNKIALSVTDEGMGISAEDKPHVFERFYRSADVRGTVPGTGLGLAIADRLASLSGGYFSVEDHVPQGTTFTLYLQKSGEGKVGG